MTKEVIARNSKTNMATYIIPENYHVGRQCNEHYAWVTGMGSLGVLEETSQQR